MRINSRAIRAGVEQTRAGIRSAQAARTQYSRDLAASFVLNLYVLRNDERQVTLFDRKIIPFTLTGVRAHHRLPLFLRDRAAARGWALAPDGFGLRFGSVLQGR